MEKKYNFIYLTESKFNGKYYIGMHSTNNLNDGYMGSGRRLNQDIKKYGSDKYDRHILEFCDSRERLIEREREIVTPTVIDNWYSLNMVVGGQEKSDNYYIRGFEQEPFNKVFFDYMIKDGDIRKIISYLIPYHEEVGWVKCSEEEIETHQNNESDENEKLSDVNRLERLKNLGLTDSEALEKSKELKELSIIEEIKVFIKLKNLHH